MRVSVLTKKMMLVIAEGFGLGLSPVASGTVGTLPGILIAWAIAGLSWPYQTAVCVVLTLVAIPICHTAEAMLGRKDDGRIVADEYMTFPISLIGLDWLAAPWILALAFVTSRVMDIIKPFPAKQLQNLRGGFGIVVDDFFSTLYALALNHVVVCFANKFFFE